MGSNQVAFCAVAILIAVFLNLIVSGLPATMTQFDISGLGLFTLSDQTKQIAEKHQLTFIPLQAGFDALCEKAAPSYWLGDGVHPTAMGHEYIKNEWLKAYAAL